MKNYIFTVIVPIYNEEDNIERLCAELDNFVKTSSLPSKILFVDDGSKDKSLEKIKNFSAGKEDFCYLSFEKNRGLSTAIQAGFDYVDTDWVGYIDADLQTHPKDFSKLAEFMNDYDLITGVRSNRSDSFGKRLSSKIANSIRRAFTHDGMDDTGCPLKMIRSEYAKKIPMFDGLHRFLPAMILLQNGKIKQVSVNHYPRIAGQSKFNLWNRLLGPLSDCFAYLWMKKKYISYNISEKKL